MADMAWSRCSSTRGLRARESYERRKASVPLRQARRDTNVNGSAREGAAVLFLGGGDRFEVFVGPRHRRARGEDVPLILDLVSGQRRDRVHFVHQLMIRGAEVALPRLQNIEFRALLEMLDDLRRFR